MVSWFNSPVLDYSFAIKPETKERKIDEALQRLKSSVDSIQESYNFRDSTENGYAKSDTSLKLSDVSEE